MEGKTISVMESQKVVEVSSSSSKQNRKDGPDGGMAWVVAIASCLINFIMAGLGRMSGILFVAFIEIFGVDRKSASMPFSVRSSTGNLFGPVVGILGQKYGARKVIVIGGIVGTISSAACFFTPDVMWITVLWGGVSGLGSALTVTLPQVVIGQYFEKHRTTAIGIAFSGGCIGSFVFPVLLEYLLENFGIEGTFLMIGAIIMHTIPAALILKKPTWLKMPRSRSPFASKVLPELVKDKDLVESETKISLVNECISKKFPVILKTDIVSSNAASVGNGFLSMCEIESLYSSTHYSEKSQFYQNLRQVNPNIFCSIKEEKVVCDPKFNFLLDGNDETVISGINSDITNEGSAALVLLKDSEVKLNEQITDASDKSISIKDLNTGKLCTLNDFGTKVTTEYPTLDPESESKDLRSNSFLDHIKTAFMLYVNPLFLMVCLCRAVHFIAFIPAMTTVVDFCLDKGLPEEGGKFAIAAISMGDLLGRLCLGWVTDRGFMSLPRYMMAVMVMQGISTASLPMMNTKYTIFANLALFGLLQGSLFVRHSVLINKYMRSNEQSIAMGCVNFISGLIGFGLPLYIGFFRDTMGSYDCIFYINGVIGACVGLLWAFEPFFVRYVNAKRTCEKIPES